MNGDRDDGVGYNFTDMAAMFARMAAMRSQRQHPTFADDRERRFWERVFIASISSGREPMRIHGTTALQAEHDADYAIEALRERDRPAPPSVGPYR